MSCEKSWIVVFVVKVTANLQNVNECLSIWYFLDCWTSLLPSLVWWCIIMSCCVTWKDCCIPGQGHSNGSYNQNITFYSTFWTADPSATKLGWLVHHHELDCCLKRFDWCVQMCSLKELPDFLFTLGEWVTTLSQCSYDYGRQVCWRAWTLRLRLMLRFAWSLYMCQIWPGCYTCELCPFTHIQWPSPYLKITAVWSSWNLKLLSLANQFQREVFCRMYHSLPTSTSRITQGCFCI